MKNKILIFVAIASISFFSCNPQGGAKQSEANDQATNSKLKLQVYYFHATHRCSTCTGIEANVKQVLENGFKEEQANGLINLKVLCVDDKANKTLAEKYEASGAALHLVKLENGKEKDIDLTEFAFMHSPTEPDLFMKSLHDTISYFMR